MRPNVFILCLAAVSPLFLSLEARAEVYKFVDEDGVVHFSNVPDDDRYFPVDFNGKRKGKRLRGKSHSRRRAKRKVLDEYDNYISEASLRFNIPQALIKAVIVVESNFNPDAVSHAGAKGLMQLMPKTAKQMGVKDIFDPRQNILGGTRYLRILANSYKGDLVLTLASYNAGQKVVDRHMDIPPIDETQRYVRRVLKLYFYFKKLYGEDTDEPDGESQ